MTGPHDPEEHSPGEEEPWYGTGDDEGSAASGDADAGFSERAEGPTDPPTQPGTVHAPVGEPATVRGPAPSEAPRPGWWRSWRVRVGAAASLAGLVLLGGGFGAGYAVAAAATPPAAAHATAATGTGQAAKGQAPRKRRQAAQRRQQKGAGTAPGTGTGAPPGATAGAPTF